jgi:hypothetical protein
MVMKSAHQNAAGGVTLGWVPLFLFLRCAYLFEFCFVGTHISCAFIGQNMMKIISVAKNRSFLGTYMAQLTCFEWKLSHLSPAFCI